MPVGSLEVGQAMLFMGEGLRVHATAKDSGGRFLIVELTSRPGGGPHHLHSHEAAEQFMCTEGRITVFTDGSAHDLTAGESVTIAPHVPHTYRNLTDAPARLLCTLSPPHDIEAFLLEVCEPVANPDGPLPPVDPAESAWAMQIAARHGMTVLGTPDLGRRA